MKYIYISLSLLLMFIVSCKKEAQQKIEVVKAKDTLKIETPIRKIEIEMRDSIKKDNWLYYKKPGEIHKIMLDETGIWDTEMTIYQGKDKESAKLIGKAEIKMILNNRFQETIHTGYINGMPYEARNTLSYDDITQEYTSTSISNIDTDMTIYKGRYDATTKTINMKGNLTNTTNGESIPSRKTIKMLGPDINLSETFIMVDSKEFKIWEVLMTRKK